jgi:hypothetical protein
MLHNLGLEVKGRELDGLMRSRATAWDGYTVAGNGRGEIVGGEDTSSFT